MPIFPIVRQVNESNLIVYFSDEINIELPTQIARIVNNLSTWKNGTIIDLTPSYTSLLICFNPMLITASLLIEKVTVVIEQTQNNNTHVETRLVEIPAYYSAESGLDLEDTAALIGISTEELIELHSQSEYTVFALGFMPGFAFMGIVPEALILPRLSTPRTNVPAGSVAIAEKQTAVYTDTSPGGWRILGRSPMSFFDLNKNPPQPYQIGDKVKFKPISKQEYLDLGGEL